MSSKEQSVELTEKAELGLRLIKELLGAEFEAMARRQLSSASFGASLMVRGLENTYGDLWARGELTRAERSLVLLGVLTALRAEDELGYHIRVGLTNGLTTQQIEEAIYQASPYVGVVASLLACSVARKTLQEVEAAKPKG